jgi:hypothetical protein
MNKNRWAVISILSLSLMFSCSVLNIEERSTPDFSADAPLSDFIYGKWESIESYKSDGKLDTSHYEIVFVNNTIVKYMWFDEEGKFIDGETYSYYFIDSNNIIVDNKRIQGEETWLLERDGQKLNIYISMLGEIRFFVLKRMNS